MPNIPNDFTIQDAARRLGINERTMRLWVEQGKFPHAYRLDPTSRSVYRIPEEDLNRFELLRQQATR